MADIKIVGMLDPGHAKNTPGKRSGKYYEYLSNRNIAKKAKDLLEATGHFKILLSVNPADAVDKSLAARAAAAVSAKCAFFISIHNNAGPTGARGTETFIHDDSNASLPFARDLHEHLIESLGTKNRGVKRANFGVLRGTYKHMVSALTEGDFFTTTAARDWMLTADFENKYAEGLAKGLCDFYDVPYKQQPVKKATPKPVVKPDDEGAQLVRVKVAQLWTYNKPDFDAKAEIVEKDEVFTIIKKVKVQGGEMYQLKSGLYITASTKYVEIAGKIQAVKKVDIPDVVIVKAQQLWTYNRPDWNAKAEIVKAGEAFTISKTLTVGDGKMYQLKSGLFITASPKYVTYKKR